MTFTRLAECIKKKASILLVEYPLYDLATLSIYRDWPLRSSLSILPITDNTAETDIPAIELP